MPRQALSEVETATSHPAGEDEVNTPPEDRTLRRHVTIKEEERDESVPEEPVMLQRVARRVHLVDNWNERVNYQRIHNQDLRTQGESLIDDQGVVFEGHGGVTPIDDMRRQFVARTGKPDKDPGDGSGDNDHHSDRGHGRCNNDRDQQDCRDDRSPPGCPTEQPVPWGPQAACCYGGDDMDQERIFVLHEFMDGEVWNWFRRHVLHTNRDKSYWTFKEVLIGLYNRFVNAATMQEAHEAFRTAVYDAQMGIQTFYDDLVGHAQNMAVYPDEFTIRETFLDRIPAEMHRTLIRNDNLSPEVNTVTKFLASCRATGQRQPVKVGTFLTKRSKMEQNCNLQFIGEMPAMGLAWANLHQGQRGMHHQEWDLPRPPLVAEMQGTNPVVDHQAATIVAGRATSQKNAKRHER
ncbi:hypothetical protein C0993_011201, partial [Termitomyces sp. T159_Od127]